MSHLRSRPKLLYLVHRVPYPPDKGDRIRSFHLLRHLTEQFDVYLAYLTDTPAGTSAEHDATLTALRRLAVEVVAVPVRRRARWAAAVVSLLCGGSATEGLFRSGELRNALHQWFAQHKFDATVIFCSSMFQYVAPRCGAAVKRTLSPPQTGRLIVDLVDVDSQKWFDYAEQVRGPRRWLYAWEGRRLRQVECRAAAQADAVTLVSPAEADCLRRFCSVGRVLGVYNGVDLAYFAPGFPNNSSIGREAPAEAPTCIFTGALDYRANIDALVWFCDNVWPTINRRRPEARLKIIGRNAVPAVTRLARLPGVDLFGSVPDVRPHLSAATMAIAPLRVARGIQNKVLEALAMGKAVVASPQAVEGLSTLHGRELVVAGSADAWISMIERLFDDAPLRNRLGEAGRRHVEQQHDWSACLAPFTRLLTEAGDPAQADAEEHHVHAGCAAESSEFPPAERDLGRPAASVSGFSTITN